MTRFLVAITLAAACGSSQPPADDATPGGVCPYTTDDACVDQDALAQCEIMATRCGDDMVVMESCPLQFACPTD
jgi:hypothetical protein